MPAEHDNLKEYPTRHELRPEEAVFDALAIGLGSGAISRGRALQLFGGVVLGWVLACIPGVAVAAPTVPGSTLPPQTHAPIPGPGTPPPGTGGCPARLTNCGGLCFDLNTDPCNCGRCGNVCAGSTLGKCCGNGVCGGAPPDTCPAPFSPGYCQEGIRPTPR